MIIHKGKSYDFWTDLIAELEQERDAAVARLQKMIQEIGPLADSHPGTARHRCSIHCFERGYHSELPTPRPVSRPEGKSSFNVKATLHGDTTKILKKPDALEDIFPDGEGRPT